MASWSVAARSADEARPPGIAKHSATTESGFAVSPGEAGSPWSTARGTTSTAVKGAVAESAEVRPPEFAKHRVFW